MHRPARLRPFAFAALACTALLVACDDPLQEWEPSPPQRFVQVTAGDEHTCAIATDRSIWCWGHMTIARLGFASGVFPCDGEVCVQPVPVYGDPEATLVDAGSEHTCAVMDGSAYCWGYAFWGQLGDARSVYQRCETPHAVTPLPCSIEPFPVALGFRVVEIAAGANHSCALAVDGTAYCFGLNQFRQTGTDVAIDTVFSPMPVTGDHRWATLTAGVSHSCGVDVGGRAWCWGANSAGALGDGQFYPVSDTPVAVVGEAFVDPAPLSWRSVDAGHAHNCGITVQRVALCWGVGGGRLGSSDGMSWPFPVRVETPPGDDVAQVTAGGYHSCALLEDGRLFCFGENRFGEVGNGGAAAQFEPARVQVPRPVTQVSAGARHTCAVDVDGAVWCWGNNDWGQLGTGDRGQRPLPTRITAST